MTETSETEAQTRTRSALGGFERDAKTFEGHLNRITASAEAFVRRCAKFAISDPDHPRLAETAGLLAEAKRILGKSEGTISVAMQPSALTEYTGTHSLGETDEQRAARLANGEPLRGPETWQLADSIRGLLHRIELLEQRMMTIDGEPISLPVHETGIADGIDTTTPEPASPLANLAPDQSARVQAAIDAAAQKRAAASMAEAAASIPVSTEPIMPNPFATMAPGTTATLDPAKIVNPFAGLTP